ncbi:MAG TPA: ATP synthase F1 subunit gamma [Geobacterales bacterium]|jgi:F-type H+-transporting ATPase subunit gamma|nr:ATP synthase F1 subunit gamma [Geobacterales bacterium]
MPSLKSIKKRISTVKNTRQITKAMKMVSAAKLRRAQEAVLAARPYAKKLQEVLQRLASQVESGNHPLLEKRGADKALVIVLTSDRGLCGGFNANLVKAADRFIQSKRADYAELKVVTIGRKGYELLKGRMSIQKNYEGLLSGINYQTASLLAQELIDGYLNNEYDEVFFVFNAFKSAVAQEITVQQLLPILSIEPAAGEEEPVDYIYEPSQSELLSEMLPKNIEVQIFKAFLESVAAEHAARMSAMDNASKNASEMIGKLTLQYNRARQAAITKELLEIISGAESIKG